MLPLLLLACLRTELVLTCETVTFELADEERFDDLGVSPAEVLAVVEGTAPFAAIVEADGRAVSGEVEVVRGAGPAVVVDGTPVTFERRVPGFGTVQPTERDQLCEDSLDVPVDVGFATDDGAIVFSLDGTAAKVDDARFEVRGDVDPGDVVALPSAPEPSAVPGLALQWTAAGLDHVSLWWDGEDYTQVLETAAE